MDTKFKKNVSDITHNHYKYLLNLSNVNGVGLGFKYINGINTNEPCIHVLVEDKIDKKYVSQNNLIPKTYMGIKTDVIKIGRILSPKNELNFLGTNKLSLEDYYPKRFRKFRPLQAGCSISCFNNKYQTVQGTLGCIVTNIVNNKKQYYILSCNHVIAYDNALPIGTYVTQPSTVFGGIPYFNSVARLDTYIPIKFLTKDNIDDPPENYIDCAIAKINDKTLISNRVLDLGLITGVAEAEIDQHVQKSGLLTGVTDGNILTLDATLYLGEFPKEALFTDQIAIDLSAGPGDSGSTILNDEGKVVGLLMALSELGYGIANKIDLVLEALNVKVYTYFDDIIIV